LPTETDWVITPLSTSWQMTAPAVPTPPLPSEQICASKALRANAFPDIIITAAASPNRLVVVIRFSSSAIARRPSDAVFRWHHRKRRSSMPAQHHYAAREPWLRST
jgi:hypothetical protein